MVSGKGLSYAEYVKQNAARDLRNEGAATFANAQVRAEIAAAKGPDIGIPSAQASKYQQIYQQDQNNKSAAVDKIGQLYGTGETTSNTGQNYYQYYASQYSRALYYQQGGVEPPPQSQSSRPQAPPVLQGPPRQGLFRRRR